MSAELERLVRGLEYRPGWTFGLEVAGREVCLGVTTTGYDTYHPERGPHYHTHHYLPVPDTPPPGVSWQRWLLEQLHGKVDLHEAMEFLRVDGHRPFAPVHSRRANTYYTVTERT